jgi:hypothetical protein
MLDFGDFGQIHSMNAHAVSGLSQNHLQKFAFGGAAVAEG